MSGVNAKSKKPAVITSTGFWLFKSEPDAFSWDMLVAKGGQGEPWTGVRNYLARNNMRAMKIGDRGFFYHSNEGLEIVGICEVIALTHPDATDGTGTRVARMRPQPFSGDCHVDQRALGSIGFR